MTQRPGLRRLALAPLAAALTLGGLAAPAVADSGNDVADLRAALATCSGTPEAPFRVTLTADLSAPSQQLVVGCDAVLDLAGHDLAVGQVQITPTESLRVTDGSTDPLDAGTLTADARGYVSGSSNNPYDEYTGILTQDATFEVAGTARVVAKGRSLGSAVGGGWYGNNGSNGTVRTLDRGSLSATAESDGAGVGSGWFHGGAVRLEVLDQSTVTASSAYGPAVGSMFGGFRDTLLVDGGRLSVESGVDRPVFGYDSGRIEVRSGDLKVSQGYLEVWFDLTVGRDGRVLSEVPIRGFGTISNDGVLAVPSVGPDLTVLGNHYRVSVDLAGGAVDGQSSVDPVTVYAPSLAAVERNLPADPTREHFQFGGWTVQRDGASTAFDRDSRFSGSSVDGTSVPVSVRASWVHGDLGVTGVSLPTSPRERDKLVPTVQSARPLPEGAVVTHEWLGRSVVERRSNRDSLLLQARQVGDRLAVRTTVSAPGYDTVTVTSARTAPVAAARFLVASSSSVIPGRTVRIIGRGPARAETFRLWVAGELVHEGRTRKDGLVRRVVTVPTTSGCGPVPVRLQMRDGRGAVVQDETLQLNNGLRRC